MINEVRLINQTTGICKVNHKFEGKDKVLRTVYECYTIYKSPSGIENFIRIFIYDNNPNLQQFLTKGIMLDIIGEFHSFNKNDDALGKRICELYVHPQMLRGSSTKGFTNNVKLTGEICKRPICKVTKQNRVIVESKLKVERQNTSGRYDYIPLVFFDALAEKVMQLDVGHNITVQGRIHSRTYFDKQTQTIRDAYEIGVQKIHSSDSFALWL